MQTIFKLLSTTISATIKENKLLFYRFTQIFDAFLVLAFLIYHLYFVGPGVCFIIIIQIFYFKFKQRTVNVKIAKSLLRSYFIKIARTILSPIFLLIISLIICR